MRKQSVLASLSLLTMIGVGLPSAATAAPSVRDLRACQKQLGKQSLAIAKFVSRQVHTCTDKIAICELAAEIDGTDATACLAKAIEGCAKVPGKRTGLVAKLRAKTLQKCEGVALADVEPFLGGLGFLNQVGACAALAPPLTPVPVAAFADLVDCLTATAFCSAEADVVRRDPRAPAALTTAGLSADFPCAAP